MPSRDEIDRAVKSATGDPDTGAVRDITPAIVDALDALCNPAPVKAAVTSAKDAADE